MRLNVVLGISISSKNFSFDTFLGYIEPISSIFYRIQFILIFMHSLRHMDAVLTFFLCSTVQCGGGRGGLSDLHSGGQTAAVGKSCVTHWTHSDWKGLPFAVTLTSFLVLCRPRFLPVLLQSAASRSQCVKAGTEEKLVLHLLHSFSMGDSSFITIFLSTYRSFTSTKRVLDILTDRWESFVSDRYNYVCSFCLVRESGFHGENKTEEKKTNWLNDGSDSSSRCNDAQQLQQLSVCCLTGFVLCEVMKSHNDPVQWELGWRTTKKWMEDFRETLLALPSLNWRNKSLLMRLNIQPC